jgi:hypothetical protein
VDLHLLRLDSQLVEHSPMPDPYSEVSASLRSSAPADRLRTTALELVAPVHTQIVSIGAFPLSDLRLSRLCQGNMVVWEPKVTLGHCQ